MAKKIIILMVLVFGVLLAACSGSSEPDQLPPDVQTALPPLSNAPDAALQAQAVQPGREAQIESVEVVILESFPVQVQVLIRGSLPNACTLLDQINQANNGASFDIAVSTVRQTDVMCAEQRQPFDQTAALDVVGLPAGTYTVNVSSANTVSSTFALALDNKPVQPPPSPELVGGTISGVVWQDDCATQADGAPGPGCMADAGGAYQPDGAFDAAEQRLAGIEVQLNSGECAAGGPGIGSAVTDASGTYLFTGLQAGSYCVAINPALMQNSTLLQAGAFTYPDDGQGRASVTLPENGYQTADFGWSFEAGRPQPLPNSAPAAACENAAEFVADVTIPDNTAVAPGEAFVKTWRVQNSGSCTWGPEYRLIFSGGEQMGAAANVPLPQLVEPGGEVEVSVNFTAPQESGSYQSDWLLQSPDGVTFGSRGDYPLYVLVAVSN